MKPRKSVLVLIVLVLVEVFVALWIYGRVSSIESLFPKIYEDTSEHLVKGPCAARQQPYPADAHPALYKNLDITAPDGRTHLCLVNVPLPADVHWGFSPDGQYMSKGVSSTHSSAYTLFEVSTAKELCSNQTNLEGTAWSHPDTCPILQLADGRWFRRDFDFLLKTGDPNIWNLVGDSAKLSPDGEWFVGYSAGGGTLASVDGKKVSSFSMPYPYSASASPPCHWTFRYLVWRADSKQFAIVQPGDTNVFVWSIQEDASVRLENQIAMGKCPYSLRLTADGKVITNP